MSLLRARRACCVRDAFACFARPRCNAGGRVRKLRARAASQDWAARSAWTRSTRLASDANASGALVPAQAAAYQGEDCASRRSAGRRGRRDTASAIARRGRPPAGSLTSRETYDGASLLCRIALPGVLAENRRRITDADPVGGVRLQDLKASVICLPARPVSLPLEHHLQGGHR